MIKPGSSPITYSSSAGSGTIYVDSIEKTIVFQNFDRLEFSNRKLQEALTTTGSRALIVEGFGGQPIQLLTTCTSDVPRPLSPDDNGVYQIKQRFNISRYTIKGACNQSTDISNFLQTLNSHLILLNRFDLYLGELSMNLSINFLEVLQTATFSFLTSTDLSLTSNIFGGAISNLLLTEFTQDVEYEAPNPGTGGGSQILSTFTATMENRTISAQGLGSGNPP